VLVIWDPIWAETPTKFILSVPYFFAKARASSSEIPNLQSALPVSI
jgi:hypothetical protein